MATQQECAAALERLAGLLGGRSGSGGSGLDRRLACHVPDLDVTFHGQLRDGHLDTISTESPARPPQIRFTVASDDLVAIADGRLGFGQAYSSGRLKVKASILDMLKLRSLV